MSLDMSLDRPPTDRVVSGGDRVTAADGSPWCAQVGAGCPTHVRPYALLFGGGTSLGSAPESFSHATLTDDMKAPVAALVRR